MRLLLPNWLWRTAIFLACALVLSADGAAPDTAAANNELLRQSTWLQKTWLTGNGLPSDSITALARTPDGFLWAGTTRGLARFDGVRFQLQRDPKATTLRDQRITSIAADASGRLWVALDNGHLHRLVSHGPHYTIDRSMDLPKAAFNLTIDASGQLWCGHIGGWSRITAEGSLGESSLQPDGDPEEPCRFLNGANNSTLRFLSGTWAQLSSTGFVNVAALETSLRFTPRRDGGYWVASPKQIGHWNGSGAIQWLADLKASVRTEQVNAIADDGAGGAWVGTADTGIIHFNGQRLQRASRTLEDVSSLLVDPWGNLWFGTRGAGLNRLRERAFQLVSTRNGLPRNRPGVVALDDAGALWAGFTGAPLFHMPNLNALPFALDGQSAPTGVMSIAIGPKGNLWFGSEDRSVTHWNGKQFSKLPPTEGVPRVLLLASDGSLWSGSSTHGLRRYRNGEWTHFRARDGAPSRSVTCLTEGADRAIWIGTSDGDLVQYEAGTFRTFRTKDGAMPRPIMAIAPRPDGSVWAASNGGGLLICNRGEIRRLEQSHGLRSDYLLDLAIDPQDRVWIASSHGLFSVTAEEVQRFADDGRSPVEAISYGRDDGVVMSEFVPSRFARATGARTILFNSSIGVLRFNTDAIKRGHHFTRPMVEHVRVAGEAVYDAAENSSQSNQPLEWSSHSDRIEIEFTAPEVGAPERLRFSSRIKGWENTWQDLADARQVTLGRYPPGKYEFELRVRGTDGVWSPHVATLPFIIRPPLWKAPWFVAAVSLSGVALLAVSISLIAQHRVRERVRALQHQQLVSRERERIARDLHDDVGANLTRLALLCELVEQQPGQSEKGTRKIPEIAELARNTVAAMDEVIWTMNPANDSVARLVGFISRWTADYLARTGLTFEEDLPEQLPEVALSSEQRHCVLMAVKEAVSNALQHSQGTTIRLTIQCDANLLAISIADDGVGFSGNDPAGHGLLHLRERLRPLGGSTEIESAPGAGTCVRIRLPLRFQPTAAS